MHSHFVQDYYLEGYLKKRNVSLISTCVKENLQTILCTSIRNRHKTRNERKITVTVQRNILNGI